AFRTGRESGEAALNLVRLVRVDGAQLHAERWRHRLDRAKLSAPGARGRIADDGHTRHPRRNVFEQLQPFCADAEFELTKAGGIAARPRQARDQSAADGIGDGDEDDGHVAACPLQRRHDRCAGGEDDIRAERDEFGRVSAKRVRIDGARAMLDPHVTALAPTELREFRAERGELRLTSRVGLAIIVEHADAPDPLALRRARRKRRRRHAAEKRDELTALHVWMAPAWQEKIERAAQRSLAVMCPACSRSPDGLLALMGSANRGLITRAGSMSQ